MGWVNPWVVLGWVQIFQFSVGWGRVGSTIAKLLKIWKDHVNAFKARLDKLSLHQAVKQLNLILRLIWLVRKPIRKSKKSDIVSQQRQLDVLDTCIRNFLLS